MSASSTALTQTGQLTLRALRVIYRQPVYLAFTLAQPMVWLLLFSQLFESVAELPGFGGSYETYLTPGVVVMTAMMNAGWAGTAFIDDMGRGVMDRFLASPMRRGALVGGVLAYQAVVTVAQSLIVLAVGSAIGARYGGGLAGILAVLAIATGLALIFSALSCAAALVLRTQEALIGIFQFVALPLVFLSSALMAPELLPGWIADLARFNPVDWAAVASREALSADPDWTVVAERGALLAGLLGAMGWLATRAFRAYQQST
jgi:ABC-2 type transport system permease protein